MDFIIRGSYVADINIGVKLEGNWKIKHQVIRPWTSVLWIEKIESVSPTLNRTHMVMYKLRYLILNT